MGLFFVSLSFVCFCCCWLAYCLCLKLGHLLRLLLVMFLFFFFVSALPEFDRSIAVGWKSFTRLNPARETSTKYCSVFCCLSLSCCLSNQNEMRASRASCANEKLRRRPIWASTRRVLPGSGHDRVVVVGWLVAVSPWSWYSSLHRHVAVGVVHERWRVQGGGHVLVAEL